MNLVTIVLVFFLFSHLAAKDVYEAFSLPLQDVKAFLSQTITTPLASSTVPKADISFVCADIKYKDGVLKFCECGDGIYASFRTAKMELNNSVHDIVTPCWGLFWHYLKQFKLPIWHVGDAIEKEALALDVLYELGGRYARSLGYLARDTYFKEAKKKRRKPGSAIASYKGIIIFRSPIESKRDAEEIKEFKRQHPDFLYVNDVARPYVKRKDETYDLFRAAGLDNHIPYGATYPQTYSPELVQTILNDFQNHNLLIVKPVYSSLSWGVNVVEKQDLDTLLTKIIRDKHTIKADEHRCFSHWKHNKQVRFAVTEYVPSKVITVRNMPHDPTMRIMFFMHHTKGQLHINVLGGFWKVPVKSLTDKGSLTEKHITIAHSGAKYSGILVDKEDMKEIKTILHSMLPKLYETMLK